MPLDNWGTPGRDTFSLDDHEQLLAFLHSDEIEFVPPYKGIQTKLSRSVASPRVRTWKKLFENEGLLHVYDSTLHLTDLGLILLKGLTAPGREHPDQNRAIAKAVLSVLRRYQLVNPTSRLEYPKRCDVFPFWTIWKVMQGTENKLHWEELNRVVIRIMRMEQTDSAIATIRKGRTLANYPSGLSDQELTAVLGHKVDLPQRSRAMSAIFSEAGFGGCIIERHSRPDGFRWLNPVHLDLIEEILVSPPRFKPFSSLGAWYRHYGSLTETPLTPLSPTSEKAVRAYPKAVQEMVIQQFVVEGKSHREIEISVLKLPAPVRGGGFKVMEILHFYGLNDKTKGLFRELPSLSEAESKLKHTAPWLLEWQKDELILVLEGMRGTKEAEKGLAEGYFSAETEMESVSSRRVRKQQDKLRDLVLETYGKKCAMCDIADPRLLWAGHIVPWSEDTANRLNPANVILLCVLHDRLFEDGMMHLDDDYKILISDALAHSTSQFLQLTIQQTTAFRLPSRFKPDPQFLRRHREKKITERMKGARKEV